MNARCFHQLIVSWRALASGLPDRRTGQKRSHTMADIASSAMAVFFTQCPSFLSVQQNLQETSGRNNAQSLFQIEHIRSDNHIRQILDPVEPTHFHSAITRVIVSPGHGQVVPLRPEFTTPHDGAVRQDCEINAAKRWLRAHAGR